MKNNIYIFLYLVLFVSAAYNTACTQTTWTKVEYNFNVGSQPPPYHYSYKITITKEGIAELEYIAGYTKTDNNTYKNTIEIEKDRLRNLKNEIMQSDILNITINQSPNDEIPEGGHSEYLVIYNRDKLLASVPFYPDLTYEKVLYKLYNAIVNCIPDNIWKEIESQKVSNMDD